MRIRQINPAVGKDIHQFYMKHRGKEQAATEQDFRNFLRRYNLKDGLIVLGRASRSILMDDHRDRVGQVGYLDPKTGVTISQPALGYLANILLISGANDYKSKHLDQWRDNLAVLCNSYINSVDQKSIE